MVTCIIQEEDAGDYVMTVTNGVDNSITETIKLVLETEITTPTPDYINISVTPSGEALKVYGA